MTTASASTLSPLFRILDACRGTLVMDEGDTIWTESSYKYHPHQLVAMLERNGFVLRRQWIEPTAKFALTLVEAR